MPADRMQTWWHYGWLQWRNDGWMFVLMPLSRNLRVCVWVLKIYWTSPLDKIYERFLYLALLLLSCSLSLSLCMQAVLDSNDLTFYSAGTAACIPYTTDKHYLLQKLFVFLFSFFLVFISFFIYTTKQGMNQPIL